MFLLWFRFVVLLKILVVILFRGMFLEMVKWWVWCGLIMVFLGCRCVYMFIVIGFCFVDRCILLGIGLVLILKVRFFWIFGGNLFFR